MLAQMTHHERVAAALKDEPVDRPPVSMWRHFFELEHDPRSMAEAMLAMQRKYDWDFMKVNPRAHFHMEDWGVSLRYSGNPYQAPTVVDYPIKTLQDWKKIGVLDCGLGVLGQHLNALGVIAMELRGGVPFLMTVFSPMSIAARLAESDEVFLSHLRERPDLVHPALEAVTETFIRFSQAVLRTGASGLFFATTSWGTYDYLTDEEYYQLARPYDLKLLKAVPEAEFHLLHVCRDRNMLRSLSDYPVDAFNWDVHGEGNLSLGGGRDITGKGVVGGIDHRILLQEGAEKQVVEEVKVQVHEMGTTGWMLGTGCTYHPRVPDINLMALREAVSGVS